MPYLVDLDLELEVIKGGQQGLVPWPFSYSRDFLDHFFLVSFSDRFFAEFGSFWLPKWSKNPPKIDAKIHQFSNALVDGFWIDFGNQNPPKID